MQKIASVQEAAYGSIRKIFKVVMGLTKMSTQNHTNTAAVGQWWYSERFVVITRQ
jgi:hypothetical protein